jgi:hypothetical protein
MIGRTMNPRLRTILLKVCATAFFMVLLDKASEAPAGHFEPEGSKFVAPLLVLICGVIVVSGKWKRAHVHLVWGCFCLTVFLSTYRLYRYHKTNDDMQREQLIRDANDARDRIRQTGPTQPPAPRRGNGT